ncbi:MAG: phosphoribosyl-ATP diphosphatase [Rhodospirillales bacterium]
MPEAGDIDVLVRLYRAILDRRTADPETSRTARLLSQGNKKIAQKLGEEAVEAALEGALGDRGKLVAESADVLYHLFVMWAACGVRPEDVWAELKRREGISGIAEKQARPKNG